MSTASTAAAIGIRITVDEKQASELLAQLGKKIDGVGAKAVGFRAELGSLAVDGLEKVTFGLGRAAAGTAKWGVGLAAVSAAGAAIGLVGMATHFATSAAVMGRSADRLGMPVEKLSEFGIAAHLAGSSAEAAQAGLAGLQATVADAAFGRNNDAFSAFRGAGIDVGDAKRGAADYAKMLPAIANQVQLLSRTNVNAAQRWLDMIGVGRELFPLLRNGAAGLKDYTDQADKLNPVTQQQAREARELEKVMVGLEERFATFARIGGAAVAPGLTHMLDELGKFLAGHKSDVEQFFTMIEHGIEWLITPRNMTWLHESLDATVDGIKHLYKIAQDLEHNPIVRHLLGLPQEAGATEGGPGVLHGIPMEDDGGALEHAIDGAAGSPGLLERGWRYLFGGAGAGSPSPRGHGPLDDPQSLMFGQHLAFSGPGLRPELQALSDTTADANGVPRDFARAIFGIEHGLNADGSPAVSPAGAVGAGQLMPATAARFGVQDSRNLGQNVAGSVQYMRFLLDRFHGNELAAGAAYNAGEGNAGVKWFAQTGDPSQLPRETQKYVRMLEQRSHPGAPAPSTPAAASPTPAAPNDAGVRRMADDALNRPAAPANAAPAYGPAADDARMGKLRIELHHVNPQPGTRMRVTETDNNGYEVDGPRVMGAMPDTGTPRNVVKDGY